MAASSSSNVQDATADPPSPPSPTASFYDMSDDEENEYSTIRHTRSGKGVKLLYAKSKVYVHPTSSAKDNIVGYVALVQQKPSSDRARSPSNPHNPESSSKGKDAETESLLLAWVPESGLADARDIYTKVDLADTDTPPKQSYLVPAPPILTQHSSTLGSYAFAISIRDIYSITVRPPSPGWWFGSIIVNTRHGNSFPPLFFHDSECQSTILRRKKLQRENFDISGHAGGVFWGGDEVIRWMKRYVNVERSTQEPSIYLIDPSDADKLSFAGKNTPNKVKNVLEGKHKDEHAQNKDNDGQTDPVVQALKQARWSFLEKMSQVTTFTRKTAQAVAENKNVPSRMRMLIQNPQVQTVSDDFDSARLYLARWAMGIAEQSERERNQRIWTAKDVLEMEDSEVGQFEILDTDAMSLADKRQPVTLQEWDGFFNSRTGRLEKTPDEVKARIFHGGLSPDDGVRKEAWLFLLDVYDWQSTKEERSAKMNSLRDEYIRLKGAWWERLVDEQGTLEEREWWKEQRMRIGKTVPALAAMLHTDDPADRAMHAVEKDVHRTDRHIPLFAGEDIPHPDPDSPFAESGTNVHLEQMKDMLLTYNEYNCDLGYVQGMSDLLAPIYAVEQDDAVAFWAFTNFMERMERNFLRDQSGMRLQLLTLDQLCQLLDPKLYEHLQKLDSTNFFFFFRMLLVWFKREFDFPDILRLWEGLWTDYLSSNFHLFIAMAILEKHREVIIDHLKGFDEVLKYVNELSGTIDLPSTMIRAAALFRRFRRTVEAIDKKTNFPSAPTIRQRVPQPPSVVTTRPRQSSQSSSTPETNSKKASITPVSDAVNRLAQQAGPSRRSGGAATTTGREQPAVEQIPPTEAEVKERVITTELRSLLSREVPKLEKKEVREHGGGVGS